MSAGSSLNSWTIVSPEESATETLGPSAEEVRQHEGSLPSESGICHHEGIGENQPTSGAESAKRLSIGGHQVSEGRKSELSGDTSTEQDAPIPPEAPVPTATEVSNIPDSDAFSQSEGLPEGLPQSGHHDSDSFSDSSTHMPPSSDAPPSTVLSPETVGGVEFTQQEEGIRPPPNEEGPLKEVESDRSQKITQTAAADSPVDSEVGEQKADKTGEELEPQVRRRRRSLLASLDQIGRTEEVEEEFQLPRQEGEGGFSLNKCILGALILLGLGTVFLSERDLGRRALRDTEAPEKQEWMNVEISPVDADTAEPPDQLVEGNEQVSGVEAQLQEQVEELNEVEGQAAEGAKERLRWEEVEKENSRLKTEMASLPVLQKENEELKRELDSVLALKKELETLRSRLPELKLSSGAHEAVQAPLSPTAAPPSGQPQDSLAGTDGSTQGPPEKPQNTQTEKNREVKKEGHDIREKEGKERKKSEWKEGEKRELKERGKSEWKNGKHEQGKLVKEKDKEGKQNGHSRATKQMKVEDWKDKARRGDQGKSWKDREGKEWKEKSDRKWIDEKDWKESKHEEVDEGKRWRVEDDKKVWKVSKEQGEKRKDREEWKGEKEWKKGKDGYKESGKDKWEKKDLGEKKEWRRDNDWRGENSKEGKWKGERKRWEENRNHGKEKEGKDERKQRSGNERKSKSNNDEEVKQEEKLMRGRKERKDWINDGTNSQKHKGHKSTGHHGREEEHVWGGRKPVHTHAKPSPEQPEYWSRQRRRLQHNPRSPPQCSSVETCAEAEGLLPVPLLEFEVILQAYLAKAEEAGVDASVRQELRNLAAEFFKDGVFVHDQMSFRDFVEDLGDVLEDMVEGEEDEDSDIEEDMEEFERAVMKKFSMLGVGVTEKRSKGEWKKESGRGHG